MYRLRYRPQMDHTQHPELRVRWPKVATPQFSSYLLWSICGLYCRLYMAYVQLMYDVYMAWPVYDTYGLYNGLPFTYSKLYTIISVWFVIVLN